MSFFGLKTLLYSISQNFSLNSSDGLETTPLISFGTNWILVNLGTFSVFLETLRIDIPIEQERTSIIFALAKRNFIGNFGLDNREARIVAMGGQVGPSCFVLALNRVFVSARHTFKSQTLISKLFSLVVKVSFKGV